MSETSLKWVVAVIISLATIAVVFAFVIFVNGEAENTTSDAICQATVLKASLKSKITSDEDTVFSMCPSKPLGVIEEKDYAFAKLILDEAESCWNKFGGGTENPVPGSWTGEDSVCFSCASFSVEETIPNFSNLFDTYLEIGDYSIKNAFFKDESLKNIYIINSFNTKYSELSQTDIKKGEWYSLELVFNLNYDFGFFLSSTDTKARIVLIKNSDGAKVCKRVENV